MSGGSIERPQMDANGSGPVKVPDACSRPARPVARRLVVVVVRSRDGGRTGRNVSGVYPTRGGRGPDQAAGGQDRRGNPGQGPGGPAADIRDRRRVLRRRAAAAACRGRSEAEELGERLLRSSGTRTTRCAA